MRCMIYRVPQGGFSDVLKKRQQNITTDREQLARDPTCSKISNIETNASLTEAKRYYHPYMSTNMRG